ncbi:endonuclease domain-containing protein [Streptacidiphilus jiangxiensis]|uniref:Recombination endonuclease VII n=1 Tax=Streptacidiphilus jiangxiensis TaxID=235985 RepID=A0A1H8ACQ4_STRJI|nr:endonuclease domain-containing protein [Streptacidiphilus jiangxiensis]SEM68333.1 Recombination endonuclease VII [Streptacidiphilus jiangxiensis]
MLIPLAAARQMVADELPEPVLRLAPDALQPHGLRDTGHLHLGARSLRGHKQSGQWHVEDQELADAIAGLSSVARSAGPLIPAGLTWTSLEGDLDDWRLTVQRELVRRAAASRQRKKAVDLLDAGLHPEVQRPAAQAIEKELAFLRGRPQRTEPAAVTGIAVLDLMKRRTGTWCIPARWAEALDAAQSSRRALLAEARRCAGCGRPADRTQEWDWRSSGADGWITQCPDCAAGAFAVYAGSMRGVLYVSERRRALRADVYLCWVCGLRQAVDWEHCHDHGYLRGPACASCNHAEAAGHGVWRNFDGTNRRTTRHLLHCHGCRTAHTLPRRHLAALVTARLRAAERHPRCLAEPVVELTDLADGGFHAVLSCPGRHRNPPSWETEVEQRTTAGWVQELLAEHG